MVDQAAREAERGHPGRGLDLVVLTETILTAGNEPTAVQRAVRLEARCSGAWAGKPESTGPI